MEAVHKDVPICKDHDSMTAILDLFWLVMAGLAKVEYNFTGVTVVLIMLTPIIYFIINIVVNCMQ